MPVVTNNLTEMLAALKAINYVPADWAGRIYSDSQVTLGRLFMGWKWSNVPPAMHQVYQLLRRRLVNWERIEYVLLDGHPTKAELLAGIGKRGHPVSEHNAWCDEACRLAGEQFLERANPKPSTGIPGDLTWQQ
jgi:ribonuclease HI